MTFLARLSLANRSLVILIAVVLSAFGAFAIPALKQQLLPSLAFPGAFVVAAYPGASPEIVEEQITEPIENSFDGMEGVTEITSTSREGLAQIQVAFDFGVDIDAAVADMQQAVSRIGPSLPDDVDPQVIAGNTDDLPVLVLAVAEDGDQREMADKLDRLTLPEIRSVEGVREAEVTGAREENVVITPDEKKLKEHGLSPAAIGEALRANGTPVPAGNLTKDDKALTVQVGNRIETIEDLKNLYLAPSAAQLQQAQQQAQLQAQQQAASQAQRPTMPGQAPPT
ncbi:hydrogenase expression protein, partial [Spongiactinospora gelatinilytica]